MGQNFVHYFLSRAHLLVVIEHMCHPAETWLKFFMDASIPAGAATEYAISFSDNRMRLDMLPDLTKDYLHDLNITVLGDVIAILKHAKAVSQKVGDCAFEVTPGMPQPAIITKAALLLLSNETKLKSW